MTLYGEYLGMPVAIDDLDKENQAFYVHCGNHQLHLQVCDDCDLMHYPTTTSCPFCGSPDYHWKPVSGKGTLYSYAEVHQAIQPLFKEFTPYLLMLVELDEQKDKPCEYDGLRMNANLVTPEGDMAPPELVRQVGIGTRLRIVYKDIGDGMALPLWTVDEEAEQPQEPWRYPEAPPRA